MQQAHWSRFTSNSLTLLASSVCTLALQCTAYADERNEDPAFKLTVGNYRFSESGNGIDANLRHSSVLGTSWVGYFNAGGLNANQFRGGWEHSLGDTVRVLPSLQVASGGFVGGSINIETGKTWFVGVGLGRTNLQPYFNLNFDPNDSFSLTGGYRAPAGVSYTLSYTRDNRDNPDQQHLHLIYRTPMNTSDRLTVDLLYKTGLVNGESINRVGATVTYDWPRFFMRLAYDPNTNFTPDNVVRISVGSRF